MRWWNRS